LDNFPFPPKTIRKQTTKPLFAFSLCFGLGGLAISREITRAGKRSMSGSYWI
jgi:hypothetical protein